jgi:hypothetical protein
VRANIAWLRHFFKADQVAFYLSMVVVLFVMVSSMPQVAYQDDDIQAGRVWFAYALLSLLLFTAVSCGMFAFVAGAITAYPHALLPTDVLGPGVIGAVLVVIAAVNWGISLWRLFPGWNAVRKYVMTLFQRCRGGSGSERKMPLRGLDELTDDLLKVAKEMRDMQKQSLKELQEMRKEMRGMRQQVQ